jgi:hypothetical protein
MHVRINNGGRRVVALFLPKVSRRRHFVVARLVATAFCSGKTAKKWSVNHEDGNRLNDSWDNLSWASIKEQQEHMRRNGFHRHGEGHCSSKLTARAVLDICRRHRAGEDRGAIAQAYGISRLQITDILLGRTWGRTTGIVRTRPKQRVVTRLSASAIVDIIESTDDGPTTAKKYGVGTTTVYRLRKERREASGYPLDTADGEAWARIQDFPQYLVSSYGRVWSGLSGGFLQTSRPNRGRYVHVALRNHQTTKWFYVHRLVASAFVPGETSVNDVVDHIDRNGANNHFLNLRFISQPENLRLIAARKSEYGSLV